MDESPKKIVDIAIARAASRAVEKEERVRKIIKAVFLFVVLLLIGFSIYFYDPDVTKPLLNAQQPTTEYLENGDIVVSIKQGEWGHYVFIGEINGKKVKFLLDTGASYVAVPTGVANYLSMPFGKAYYSNTANGKSLSYSSLAKEVKVGGIRLYNVKASVATGMERDEILLGMSFLKSLSVTQANGIITIKQTHL